MIFVNWKHCFANPEKEIEMLTLIFDTETNGVIKRNTDFKMHLPDICQLAAKLVRGKQIIAQYSTYLSPERRDGRYVTVPTEKFFLDNNMSTENLNSYGVESTSAMATFEEMWLMSDRVACHNAAFDLPLALREAECVDIFLPQRPVLCTMETLTPIMNLPGKFGKPKWPRLDESYEMYVNAAGFEGAHDAMADVTATHELIQALAARDVPLKEITPKVYK